MLDLNDFFLFVQVVDRGGFTAASRTLRTPKSTLSHRIQQLEGSLGVRLLNRTSRKFGMTDAGKDFYRHAVAMLREAELAENAVRHRLTRTERHDTVHGRRGDHAVRHDRHNQPTS